MSHISEAVLDAIIANLNECYGQVTPLTVTKGTTHKYLGMTLDYTVPGEVTIRMDDYVQEILSEAPDDMSGTSTTPAGEHLFDVSDDPTRLNTETADLFHHLTVKLLFLCK